MMRLFYPGGILRMVCVALMVLLVSGCLHNVKKTPTACVLSVASDEAIEGKDFSAKAKELKDEAALSGDTQEIARAHLKAARLYMHYRNPERSYHRALQEIEASLAAADGGVCHDEAMNMKVVISELLDAGDMKTSKMGALQEENKSCKLDLDVLQREKEALLENLRTCEDTIQELQNIDIHIEKKRKGLR